MCGGIFPNLNLGIPWALRELGFNSTRSMGPFKILRDNEVLINKSYLWMKSIAVPNFKIPGGTDRVTFSATTGQ